MTIWDFLYS
jgi:hypothetical protein